MILYDGIVYFRRVGWEGFGGSPGVPRGLPGLPGRSLERPWLSPGFSRGTSSGPWEGPRPRVIPKGIHFSDGGPFFGIHGGSQGVPRASPGGLCEVPRESHGFLWDPWGIFVTSLGPRWGRCRSLRWDLVFRPQTMQQRNKS